MHQSWKQQKCASDWLKLKGECTRPTRWEVRADASSRVTSSSNYTIRYLSVCLSSIHPSTHPLISWRAFFCVDVLRQILPTWQERQRPASLDFDLSWRDYPLSQSLSCWGEGFCLACLDPLSPHGESGTPSPSLTDPWQGCKCGKFQKGGVIRVRQKGKRHWLPIGPYSNVWKWFSLWFATDITMYVCVHITAKNGRCFSMFKGSFPLHTHTNTQTPAKVLT